MPSIIEPQIRHNRDVDQLSKPTAGPHLCATAEMSTTCRNNCNCGNHSAEHCLDHPANVVAQRRTPRTAPQPWNLAVFWNSLHCESPISVAQLECSHNSDDELNLRHFAHVPEGLREPRCMITGTLRKPFTELTCTSAPKRTHPPPQESPRYSAQFALCVRPQ